MDRAGPTTGVAVAIGSDRLRRLAADPRRHLLALALLVLCGALLWTSERGRSLTADEPLHLIRGHAYWWTKTARLSYAHPPLANAVTSLPYAGRGDAPWGPAKSPAGEPRSKRSNTPESELTRAEALPTLSGWEIADPLRVSSAYFRHDFARAMAEMTGARRMMMLWTLALAAFVYLWMERRYGWSAALIGLGLFAVHPTILAHGRLATTDLPLAATAFVSVAATIAWIERPSWTRVGLFGLATTAMVLTKHSGAPITVVLGLIVLGAAALGRAGFETVPGSRWARVRAIAVVFAQLSLIALVMIVAIAAAYRFDRVGLTVTEILAEPEPHNWISKKHEFELLETSPIAKLPGDLRVPFPYTWLVGLATVSKQNAMGHGNYFFGLREHAGHPLYFPVLLFAKSPTGLLLLLGAGFGVFVARLRRREWPSLATTVLLIFAGVSLASACASNINIGVRHVLPLMVVSVVLAGRSGALLLEGPRLGRLGRRGGPALVIAALLSCGLGAASTFPAWLGDFNLLVGGPAGGQRISVIGEDWGQDVGDLGRLANDRGWTRIVYYTNFPLRKEQLEALGIKVRKLRCRKPKSGGDPVAIHMSDWVRKPACFAWLDGREPDELVNHNILVFTSE